MRASSHDVIECTLIGPERVGRLSKLIIIAIQVGVYMDCHKCLEGVAAQYRLRMSSFGLSGDLHPKRPAHRRLQPNKVRPSEEPPRLGLHSDLIEMRCRSHLRTLDDGVGFEPCISPRVRLSDGGTGAGMANFDSLTAEPSLNTPASLTKHLRALASIAKEG